jgi:divalent metal cation (Fe/Co/Zn/Cd) transporter
MALVTIFALATIILAFRRKEWLLAVIALITGIMLMTTGTDIGKSVSDGLTAISKTIDSVFTKN